MVTGSCLFFFRQSSVGYNHYTSHSHLDIASSRPCFSSPSVSTNKAKHIPKVCGTHITPNSRSAVWPTPRYTHYNLSITTHVVPRWAAPSATHGAPSASPEPQPAGSHRLVKTSVCSDPHGPQLDCHELH